MTECIYQLRDEQQKALLDYLLAENDSGIPLPLLPDRDNRIRLGPSVARTHTNSCTGGPGNESLLRTASWVSWREGRKMNLAARSYETQYGPHECGMGEGVG